MISSPIIEKFQQVGVSYGSFCSFLPSFVKRSALYLSCSTPAMRDAAHRIGFDVTPPMAQARAKKAERAFKALLDLAKEHSDFPIEITQTYGEDPYEHTVIDIADWLSNKRQRLGDRSDSNRDEHKKLDEIEAKHAEYRDAHHEAQWAHTCLIATPPRGGMYAGIQNTALRRTAQVATFAVLAGLLFGGAKAIYNVFNNITGGNKPSQSTNAVPSSSQMNPEEVKQALMKAYLLGQQEGALQAQGGKGGLTAGPTIDVPARTVS